MLSAQLPPNTTVPPRPMLSKREVEVAALIVEGLSNDEIAERLVVSVRTVQSHVARSFEKLGVHSRTGLAVAALRHGIVPLDAGAGTEGGG